MEVARLRRICNLSIGILYGESYHPFCLNSLADLQTIFNNRVESKCGGHGLLPTVI